LGCDYVHRVTHLIIKNFPDNAALPGVAYDLLTNDSIAHTGGG